MTEELKKTEESKPDCIIPRKTAYMILLIGLLLISFAYGCEMIAAKNVDKVQAAAALAKSEFDAKWELKEMELNEAYEYDKEPDAKIDSPEYKAWKEDKDKKIEGKAKAIEEMEKAYKAEQKEMRKEWYEMSVDAKNAENNSKSKSCMFAWLFFLGLLALVFSTVVIAFTGDKIERIIMLILIAAIAYSFFGGKLPLL